MKPYIQPFERELALEEASALLGVVPVPVGDCSYGITASASGLREFLNRCSYWVRADCYGELAHQVRREASVEFAKHRLRVHERSLPLGIPLRPSSGRQPRRRVLRFGVHGIHEYRGKFFPQLVRVLLNISKIKKDEVVLDPMIGSGTSAVEALMLGCRAAGIDMNPLSVFISRTKCQLVKTPVPVLESDYQRVMSTLQRAAPENGDYLERIGDREREYLEAWFTAGALSELSALATAIERLPPSAMRSLAWTTLSNILRRASLQRSGDLRVRRVAVPDLPYQEIKRTFLKQLDRTFQTVVACAMLEPPAEGPFDIVEGDARHQSDSLPLLRGAVKAIVTSPPYATALPYLDTDRLSLLFMGLLDYPALRARDELMIGNRELRKSLREKLELMLEHHAHRLPPSVVELITTIAALNSGREVGFRRRNLPVLLGKYFIDMRDTFASSRAMVRDDGVMWLVVGDNHTLAGGRRIDIHTARLLAEIAEMERFRVVGLREMEMLVSRDIHRANASRSESIIELRPA